MKSALFLFALLLLSSAAQAAGFYCVATPRAYPGRRYGLVPGYGSGASESAAKAAAQKSCQLRNNDGLFLTCLATACFPQ